MKGITPVIAMVVILVMTISAGGLAYLTVTGYQQQVEQGSSASNEEMLEQMQTQVRVESVNNGQLILRNIGTRALQDETFTAFVGNVPVVLLANPDCADLEPGKTCTADIVVQQNTDDVNILTVTTPSGNEINVTKKDKCVMVSLDVGSAGEMTTANAHCTDSPDLFACDNDGACETSSNENAVNCPDDCSIQVLVASFSTGTVNSDVYSIIYNGTEWNIGQNITDSAAVNESYATGTYDAYGDYFAAWVTNGFNRGQAEFSIMDGSTGIWSAPSDVEGMTVIANDDLFGLYDGRVLFGAQDRSATTDKDMIRALWWNGTEWGSLGNVSLTSEMESGHYFKFPEFGYSPAGPIAVYMTGIGTCFVQSAVWNGTQWTGHTNLTTSCSLVGHCGATSNSRSNILAVWNEQLLGPGYQIRSAQWNGSSWTDYQNVTDVNPDSLQDADVATDPYGYSIAVYRNGTDDHAYAAVKSPSSSWGAPSRISDDSTIAVFVLESVPGSVAIFWVEDIGGTYVAKTRAWNGISKTFDPVETIMSCDRMVQFFLANCTDVYT